MRDARNQGQQGGINSPAAFAGRFMLTALCPAWQPQPGLWLQAGTEVFFLWFGFLPSGEEVYRRLQEKEIAAKIEIAAC